MYKFIFEFGSYMEPFIGVLCWEEDSATGKLIGANWNPKTFSFPIKIKMIKGANFETIVKNPTIDMLNRLIRGAQEFESEGAKAITTDCGFNALWQEELAESVNIPVFTSGLLLVPLVQRMIGKNKRVAIITADSRYLTERHLKAVGIDESIRTYIIGLEDYKDFYEAATVSGKTVKYLDDEAIRKLQITLAEVGKQLIQEHPDIGAIVLECTDLPPFAGVIQEVTKLPVFDIVTLMNMVYLAIHATLRSHRIK
jgi:Asp/Glu/hydantoin racemase